jgi:hypothetical protein
MMAKRSLTLAQIGRSVVSVTLVMAAHLASLGLGGCGGGGGDVKEPRVVSQGLVSDGSSACTIQAEVDGGSGVVGSDGEFFECGGFASFELFDAGGSELNIDALSNFFLLAPDRRTSFGLRICRHQAGGLVLISDSDPCSAVPTLLNPKTLTRYPPPRDVPCEEFSRVQTNVSGCGD